jgi:tetratricopeptide (TPR) repeat protein
MLGELRSKLFSLGRLDLMEGVAHRVAGYYDRRGAIDSDEDRYLAAKARVTVAGVFSDRNDLAAATRQAEAARDVLTSVTAHDPDRVSYQALLDEAVYLLIDIQFARGDLTGALTAAQQQLAVDERLLAAHPHEPDPLSAFCVGSQKVARLLARKGDNRGAMAQLRHEIEVAGARGGESPSIDDHLMVAHEMIGTLLRKVEYDRDGGLREQEAALGVATRRLSIDPQDTVWKANALECRLSIAGTLIDSKDLKRASETLGEALPLAEQLVEVEPAKQQWQYDRGRIHELLGDIRAAQHDGDAALVEYRASYAALAKLADADPTDLDNQRQLSVGLNKVGDAELATHHRDSALMSYRNALAIRQRLVDKDPSNAGWRRDLFYSHTRIGRVLVDQDKRGALSEVEHALSIAQEIAANAPDNPAAQNDLVETHMTIGEIRQELHDLAGARSQYRAALEIARREAAMPKAPPMWAELVHKVDVLLAKAGANTPH